MRIVIDYRSALRARSGVGEYVHQLARRWRLDYPDDQLTLFTSSWKDRPPPTIGVDVPGARISDHRIPVSVLNFAWHRLQWPAVESLSHEEYDVAFSPHPLLLPSRHAARVVMVHDLDFMKHPERTHREIRRDYPRLAAAHARRAQRVIVPSSYTAAEVIRFLAVPAEKIVVCPHGVPDWQAPARAFDPRGYLLFMGTLAPRKNVDGLLTAYERLLGRSASAPPLLLVGTAGEDARGYLQRIGRAPLAGHVTHRGYVPDAARQAVYAGARALVLPSFDEGFGMPVLEAMSLGIPVVASARGALPELIGDAGLLVDPADEASVTDALERVSVDDTLAATLSARGLARASEFSWQRSARITRDALAEAIAERL